MKINHKQIFHFATSHEARYKKARTAGRQPRSMRARAKGPKHASHARRAWTPTIRAQQKCGTFNLATREREPKAPKQASVAARVEVPENEQDADPAAREPEAPSRATARKRLESAHSCGLSCD